MRFTVHDSPDYYQLKVSVFNDDKKTELIGETWVALDKIVVVGGGQNDLWHHLNCKGRFAGEIRIELTYYDTRPKDEVVEELPQETPVKDPQEKTREGGVIGPRLPKPVKRRPLPTNPTESLTPRSTMQDHHQSSPTPFTPPNNQSFSRAQPQYVDEPTDYRLNTTAPSISPYQHVTSGESPMTYNSYGQELYDDSYAAGLTMNHATAPQPIAYSPAGGLDNRQDLDGELHLGSLNDRNFRRSLPYEGQYRPDDGLSQDYYSQQNQRSDLSIPRNEHALTRPPIHPLNDAYNTNPLYTSPSIPQTHSMPDVRPHPVPRDFDHQNHGSSRPRNINYETPTRHQSLGASGDAWPSPVQTAVANEGPPPPPAHRSTTLQSLPSTSGGGHSESYPPISAPAPLNIRNHRASTSASPLSQVQSNASSGGYISPSPSSSQPISRSTASISTHTSYNQPDRRNSQNLLSQSPVKDFDHSLPPSLVPGYEPGIAEDESQRLLNEKRTSARQIYSDEPSPQQYQALPAYSSQPRLHQSPSHDTHPSPRHDAYPSPRHNMYPSPRTDAYPSPRNDPYSSPRHDAYSSRNDAYPSPRDGQSPLRQLENSHDRRPHSHLVATGRSPAVSPDPRTPVRKSVSPAPESASGPRSISAVPFSPDSYDAFNPSITAAAASINSAGPKYNTPEQAREALREREKELKLEEGPIIGSNGRVIDPSDHLPSDTWAPEPEAKPPRKGPEVTLRFRHSPQGAQPMPSSGTRRPLLETPSRPHSVSTPVYTHSPDANSGARNRLLKKSRISPAQPASSPIVPTLNTTPTARSSMPRAAASDYPLREHENYGYGSTGSPTYNMRNSPGGLPPPVPGKIPISVAQGGQDEWSMSALSEEMRRIDIGVGGGQGRARRTRFGA